MAPALATRAGCLLSHFSSHLNRKWEGKRREKQFELNHMYEVQLCSPNSSNPDRTTLCHAFATCFTPLPSSSLVHSSVTSILQLKVSCYSHSPSTLMALPFCFSPSRCLFSAQDQRSNPWTHQFPTFSL